MKLYTEEQVKESFYNGVKYASAIHPASIGWINQYVEGIINSLTPIELPSDDEIRKRGWEDADAEDDIAFFVGAKWIKEQILNQNNKLWTK